MHRDYLGREIKVGDTVVYPGRMGGRMWLTKGTVTALTEVSQWGETGRKIPAIKIAITSSGVTFKSGRTITSVNLDRMVVVPQEGS
jgi:hypothetical protein